MKLEVCESCYRTGARRLPWKKVVGPNLFEFLFTVVRIMSVAYLLLLWPEDGCYFVCP